MTIWQSLGLSAFMSPGAWIFRECTPTDLRTLHICLLSEARIVSQWWWGALPKYSSAKCRAVKLLKCLWTRTKRVYLTLEAWLEGKTWTVKLFEMNFSDSGSLDSHGRIWGKYMVCFLPPKQWWLSSFKHFFFFFVTVTTGWLVWLVYCSILTSLMAHESFPFGLVICFCS